MVATRREKKFRHTSFVPINVIGPLKFYDGACHACSIRERNRTTKFALIDSITRLFQRLIRFRKFIFGSANGRDSAGHVLLVTRGNIFDSLASRPCFSRQTHLHQFPDSPCIRNIRKQLWNYMPTYRDRASPRKQFSKQTFIPTASVHSIDEFMYNSCISTNI